MRLLENLNQISKDDVLFAGGKGASLGEMIQNGIPVPHGFVILSTAFKKFLEETDLDIEIDSILHTVDHEKIHTIEDASAKIKALILDVGVPKDISEEIRKFFNDLNVKYVAVRSSATAEDSTSAAWAGQLESYLNTTEETLLENVKKCWASLFTPRAIFYRFEKDLHKQEISVAVVVQEMVESEKSGIAFSVHPVTQDRNQLIIEAGFGLGESIVSGQITPDSYVVEKQPRRIIDKNMHTQGRGLYRAEAGGNEWRHLSETQEEGQVLSDKEILELSEIVLKIENHYDFPCDIEWAFEDGEFYIVQSRPITTLDNRVTENATEGRKILLSNDKGFSGVDRLIFEKSITRDWPLFIVEVLHKGLTDEFKEQIGFRYSEVLFDIYSNHLDIYRAPLEHIEKMRTFILLRLAKDPKFITTCSKSLRKHYEEFLKIINTIDRSNLQELSDKELMALLKDFIRVHTRIEPTFVINFWFPIQMENHPERAKWEGEISVAAKTRVETEKVGPEGDRIARRFAQEVSKRMFSSEEYSRLISLSETYDFLCKGRLLDESEVKRRMNGFVFGAGGIKFTTVDAYAESEGYKVKKVEVGEDEVIKGNIAYPGIVRGRVRIVISKEKIGVVEKGDVLVTAMTTPEFMPALKKAVAFVTDEGGITSHAAIVSRELKKPCIIGTKIATRRLKDNDLVEVDANNGTIMILEETK